MSYQIICISCGSRREWSTLVDAITGNEVVAGPAQHVR